MMQIQWIMNHCIVIIYVILSDLPEKTNIPAAAEQQRVTNKQLVGNT
jgi:hypothetical protein